MVFTSVVNFVRSRGPDEFWRKRRIFKLAAVSTVGRTAPQDPLSCNVSVQLFFSTTSVVGAIAIPLRFEM